MTKSERLESAIEMQHVLTLLQRGGRQGNEAVRLAELCGEKLRVLGVAALADAGKNELAFYHHVGAFERETVWYGDAGSGPAGKDVFNTREFLGAAMRTHPGLDEPIPDYEADFARAGLVLHGIGGKIRLIDDHARGF